MKKSFDAPIGAFYLSKTYKYIYIELNYFDALSELSIYYITILSIDLKNAISFDALFFELFFYDYVVERITISHVDFDAPYQGFLFIVLTYYTLTCC